MSKRNAMAFEALTADDRKRPGAYWFMFEYSMELQKNTDRRVGMHFACPCGCGGSGTMWFKGGSGNGTGAWADQEWDMVGELPNASMTPSIGYAKSKATGEFHWHGFLTDGEFREC